MARSFNGTSAYADAGNNAVLTVVTSLTIAAWIYPTVSGNGAYRTFLCKKASPDGTGHNNYEMGLNNDAGSNAGSLYFYHFNGLVNDIAISTFVPNVNEWSFIGATVTGGNALTIYGGSLGNVISRKTATLSFILEGTPGDGNVLIGANLVSNHFFQGRMAEVAIWNLALSANEMAALGSGAPIPRFRQFQAGPVGRVLYVPLWGLTSPEPNIIGGYYTGVSLTGSPTAAAHPPAQAFSKRFWSSSLPSDSRNLNIWPYLDTELCAGMSSLDMGGF